MYVFGLSLRLLSFLLFFSDTVYLTIDCGDGILAITIETALLTPCETRHEFHGIECFGKHADGSGLEGTNLLFSDELLFQKVHMVLGLTHEASYTAAAILTHFSCLAPTAFKLIDLILKLAFLFNEPSGLFTILAILFHQEWCWSLS